MESGLVKNAMSPKIAGPAIMPTARTAVSSSMMGSFFNADSWLSGQTLTLGLEAGDVGGMGAMGGGGGLRPTIGGLLGHFPPLSKQLSKSV